MRHRFERLIKQSAFYFGGDQPTVTGIERLRSGFGVLLGLFFVLAIARFLGQWAGVEEWLMASLGASAVIVFAIPGSPMAQPWAVIAGNTLSALIGIGCANTIAQPILAMPIAATLSILSMFGLRCLHPPAAAVALIAVMGHIAQLRYAVFPVMIDSIILVLIGAIYSNLTGKRYPNRPIS